MISRIEAETESWQLNCAFEPHNSPIIFMVDEKAQCEQLISVFEYAFYGNSFEYIHEPVLSSEIELFDTRKYSYPGNNWYLPPINHDCFRSSILGENPFYEYNTKLNNECFSEATNKILQNLTGDKLISINWELDYGPVCLSSCHGLISLFSLPYDQYICVKIAVHLSNIQLNITDFSIFQMNLLRNLSNNQIQAVLSELYGAINLSDCQAFIIGSLKDLCPIDFDLMPDHVSFVLDNSDDVLK